MKIISGARQVHCDKCGCIYEFDAEDIKVEVYCNIIGIRVGKSDPFVMCPICDSRHYLTSDYDLSEGK